MHIPLSYRVLPFRFNVHNGVGLHGVRTYLGFKSFSLRKLEIRTCISKNRCIHIWLLLDICMLNKYMDMEWMCHVYIKVKYLPIFCGAV